MYLCTSSMAIFCRSLPGIQRGQTSRYDTGRVLPADLISTPSPITRVHLPGTHSVPLDGLRVHAKLPGAACSPRDTPDVVQEPA